jgi:inosine-uridine nucleoside N-ribohydrolase
VHGPEGFGDIPAETPKGRAIDESAPEYLVRMARELKGELVVAPIGPLTNIAEAIKLDPEFVNNVKNLAIMGGAVFVKGNITKFAEANIYHDPDAANFVLQSGAAVTLVGLDVTLKTLCTPEDFTRIAKGSPKLGGFLQDMSHFYIKFYQENEGLNGCGLHDPVALIAATHPELFTLQDLPIEVVTAGESIGQTVICERENTPKIKVCTDVSTQTVVEMFVSGVASND